MRRVAARRLAALMFYDIWTVIGTIFDAQRRATGVNSEASLRTNSITLLLLGDAQCRLQCESTLKLTGNTVISYSVFIL